MPRGGKRTGAGRPRKEPTKRISVPVSLLEKIKTIINKLVKENAK